jgi:hypothetical protein
MTLELIREVESERDEAAKATPQDQTCLKIAALGRIRGVGDNFAAVLTCEVFYRSFDNRRQIASYVGITPMPYQSGNHRLAITAQAFLFNAVFFSYGLVLSTFHEFLSARPASTCCRSR